jgi:phosphoribosylglycinamide formyltransferase-1
LADRDCNSLKFAESKNIFAREIIYSQNSVSELRSYLTLLDPDMIVTNIHKIIDEETLTLWEGKFINVHYSLLPSFAGMIGMETVKKAKEQNVKFVGGTCHSVTKHVDAGRIIQQGCFSVDWDYDDFVIECIFKTTCYCLLGSIYNDKKFQYEIISINNYNVHFSPPINFEENKFNSNFWKLIKNN